jgi:hypothetical protein
VTPRLAVCVLAEGEEKDAICTNIGKILFWVEKEHSIYWCPIDFCRFLGRVRGLRTTTNDQRHNPSSELVFEHGPGKEAQFAYGGS